MKPAGQVKIEQPVCRCFSSSDPIFSEQELIAQSTQGLSQGSKSYVPTNFTYDRGKLSRMISGPGDSS